MFIFYKPKPVGLFLSFKSEINTMKSQHKLFFTVTCGIFLVLLSRSHGEVRGPQAYGTCYQNITTDRAEEGFIQMFAMAINKSNVIIQGDNTSFYRIDTVMMTGLGNSDSYNNTPPFTSALRKPDPVSISSSRISNFGIIVTSDNPVSVIGVKSDKGTTDAYYNFPQTNNSVEFIIVGWQRIEGQPFMAMIMAIPVLDGTCIELFKIFNGDTYRRIAYESVGRFQVFRYFPSYETSLSPGGDIIQDFTTGEDVTGMYLNASKPVQVIFGGECAWIESPADLFCDYIADPIAPRNQLGTTYIVPPIFGRSGAAGYIVRVVPVMGTTVITYENGKTATKKLGEFLQFDHAGTQTSTVVTCSQPCAVYQYNKGYLKFDDVPTDPFMMMTVPVDRFTAGAPFGTASFCQDKNELIDFDNYITVVTFDAYKGDILYDGSPITDQMTQPDYQWQNIQVNGVQYAVAGFKVQHGFHFVSMSAGVEGSFAVYAYGHSLNPDSSSGYGYFCNYNSTGEGVKELFAEAKQDGGNNGNPDANVTCTSDAYLLGQIISGNVGQYVPFPFRLRAGIEPGVPLTPACLAQYHDQLLQLLRDFSKKINYWICVSQNCSFLGGEGVAINYDTLSVEYFGNNGVYYAVEIYVEMIARLDVTAENYATCRAEIQNYMYYFVNWPPEYTKDLLHQIVGSGCPWPIPFQEPKFVAKPVDCPVTWE